MKSRNALTMIPRLLCAIALLLLGPLSLQAQGAKEAPYTHPVTDPFLWKVDGPTPSYLFGTIHLPHKDLKEFPPAVESAFVQADVVMTEIPMDMASQAAAMGQMFMTDGKTVKDVLPKELYDRTNKLLAKKKPGMSLETPPVATMQVWAVFTTLATLDHLEELMAQQPLDAVVATRGGLENKEVGALETVQSQLDVFKSLTLDDQIHVLNETVKQFEDWEKEGKKGSPSDELMDIYLKGDEKKIIEYLNEEYDPNDAVMKKFMDKLMTERDGQMADKIAGLIKDNPGKSYFFAVGALHYTNENSIVKRLGAKGFKVERINRSSQVTPRAEAVAK